MSLSGISSSNLFNYDNQNVQNKMQQFQQEFQQLGEDLQSGNLSAAQTDFATLQQLSPQSSSTTSTSSSESSNPLAQAFNQLAQDIQSGNLSAAQQDYSNIQQDFQNQSTQAEGHHHHHHGGGDSSQISSLFQQLGQALQSGNVSSAQQIFGTLQTDIQQFSQSTGQAIEPSQTTTMGVSVTA